MTQPGINKAAVAPIALLVFGVVILAVVALSASDEETGRRQLCFHRTGEVSRGSGRPRGVATWCRRMHRHD